MQRDESKEKNSDCSSTAKEEDEDSTRKACQRRGESSQTSLQRGKDKNSDCSSAMEKEDESQYRESFNVKRRGQETVKPHCREVKDKEEELQTAKESSEKEDEDKPIQRIAM